MSNLDKEKLKHDFLNSMVIINCMTQSASTLLNKIQQLPEAEEENKKQRDKFLSSMNAIREQTSKIEHYFLSLLNS